MRAVEEMVSFLILAMHHEVETSRPLGSWDESFENVPSNAFQDLEEGIGGGLEEADKKPHVEEVALVKMPQG